MFTRKIFKVCLAILQYYAWKDQMENQKYITGMKFRPKTKRN